MERRRNSHSGQPSLDTLKQLPALVVLERVPVPVLAVAHDGSILFANTAFAEMIGSSTAEVLSMKFHQVFYSASADESVLSVVDAPANRVVELAHEDGSVVRALMSRSAAARGRPHCPRDLPGLD